MYWTQVQLYRICALVGRTFIPQKQGLAFYRKHMRVCSERDTKFESRIYSAIYCWPSFEYGVDIAIW